MFKNCGKNNCSEKNFNVRDNGKGEILICSRCGEERFLLKRPPKRSFSDYNEFSDDLEHVR